MSAAQDLMQCGAHAVKLEGAAGNLKLIQNLTESGVPVMGHLGLTPQFVHTLGGYKVQGRSRKALNKLNEMHFYCKKQVVLPWCWNVSQNI